MYAKLPKLDAVTIQQPKQGNTLMPCCVHLRT